MSAQAAADDVRGRAAALEELLLAREYLYGLFHKLTAAAPDADALEALLGEAAADAAGAYADDDATMRGFVAFLGELAAREDRAALLDAVRDEFTRLFVGPGALPAPTWESPYLTKEPTVFQENTLAVRTAYRAHGLEPKRLQRMPDDHVALLQAFMAERARAARAALRAGDSAALAVELRDELAFVRGHLTSWLDAFALALRPSRTAVLYPQLVEALAAFAAVDATFLAEAAYWVESLEGQPLEAAGDASLAGFERALDDLAAVRPFGIEDYELVSCGRDASRNPA